jgi:hypothetical protein
LTREQLIVLGFLVAAFVAGWVARALIAARDRRGRSALPDERVERSLDRSRRELQRAIDAYQTAVGGTSGAPAPSSPRAGEESSGEATLVDEVTDALRSDAANETMLGGVPDDRHALSDLELDLADWGFTYGVAWARARARGQDEPDAEIAREALPAARTVFEAYTHRADWTRPLQERRASKADRVSG